MSSLPDRSRALALLRGPTEWLLFVRICAHAMFVPVLMRMPLPHLRRLLRRARRGKRITVPHESVAERLAELVALAQTVGHPVVRAGCLTRNVTLYWFLTRSGFDVELRFGLEELEEEVAGHCWLTRAGEPFLERVDPRTKFVELFRVPAASGA